MLNHIVSLKIWTITGRKPELKPLVQQTFLPVHHHRHAEIAVRPTLFDVEQKTSLRRPSDIGHRSPPRPFWAWSRFATDIDRVTAHRIYPHCHWKIAMVYQSNCGLRGGVYAWESNSA